MAKDKNGGRSGKKLTPVQATAQAMRRQAKNTLRMADDLDPQPKAKPAVARKPKPATKPAKKAPPAPAGGDVIIRISSTTAAKPAPKKGAKK